MLSGNFAATDKLDKIYDWTLAGSFWGRGGCCNRSGNDLKSRDVTISTSKKLVEWTNTIMLRDLLTTLQAIKTGWVHPNINLENPDKGVVC